MSPKSQQRIARVSVPLYKEMAKRASKYGYTLTEALAKIIESYKRRIKRLEKELEKQNIEIEELGEFKWGMKPLTDLPCNVCGKPMDNNWTTSEGSKIRDEIIELVIKAKGWGHSSCHKTENK